MNTTLKILQACPKHDEPFAVGWMSVGKKALPEQDEHSICMMMSVAISILEDVGIVEHEYKDYASKFRLTVLGERVAFPSNKINLNALQSLLTRILSLLNDRHPDLMTWNEAFLSRLSELSAALVIPIFTVQREDESDDRDKT